MFKSGAVSLTRISQSSTPPPNGSVAIHAKEQQTPTQRSVRTTKPDAPGVIDHSREPRTRHLPHFVRTLYSHVSALLPLLADTLPSLLHNPEIALGLRALHRIATGMVERLQPFQEQYGEDGAADEEPDDPSLSTSVFQRKRKPGAYGDLMVLQQLQMYLAHVEGSLGVLTPVSQALWDGGFVEAVAWVTAQVGRMQAWVKQEISVRAAQTILVPQKEQGGA